MSEQTPTLDEDTISVIVHELSHDLREGLRHRKRWSNQTMLKAINTVAIAKEENARLRAALEKFADAKDWAIIVLESGLRYEACYKFRGDQKADPWQIAQEALKGREGDDA